MINLAPPEIREQIKFGRHNLRIMHYLVGISIISAAVAVIIFVGTTLIDDKSNELEQRLALQSEQLDSFDATVLEAEKLSQTIDVIKALLDREVLFSELLTSIAELIPRGAYLDSIALSNKQDTLQLLATLDSQELAAVFQKNLAQSDLFSVADIVSIVEAEDGRYRGTFTVVFKQAAEPATDSTEGES